MKILNLFIKYKLFFLKGAFISISLSFLAVLFGTMIGLLMASMKLSKNSILKFLASLYVEVIRGTPMIVQMFIVYFNLKPFKINTFIVGLIAVSINSGAYVCEIIRSGIQSIDKGQMEAGRSLGMSEKATMRKIILPQAVKNILPALCGEFVTVIKETSIAAIMGVKDLYYSAQTVGAASYNHITALYVVGIMYLIITFSLSKAISKFERRLAQS